MCVHVSVVCACVVPVCTSVCVCVYKVHAYMRMFVEVNECVQCCLLV